MYRWDWLILYVTAFNLIKTSDGVSVPSLPSIVISPTSDLFPHWQTTFTLQCEVKDWPGTPVFFWKRDGSTLYPNADSKIDFSEDKQSIVFNEVTQQQSGSYYCLALEPREYLFESSDSVEIAVQEPPLIPKNVTVIAKTSTSLHLRWEPQGDIASEYYVVVQKPGGHEYTADQFEVVISKLDPYSIYSFSVSAHNIVGSRGKSSELQTRTEPGPPSGVLEFSVGIRTSESLQVVWSVPSEDITNDQLTGYELMVHATVENILVTSLNFTLNHTETVVSGLSPETLYTLSMAFRTRCCVSEYDSKDSVTMREGKTMAPTNQPRTEGNTAQANLSSGAIVGIALGCGVLIAVLLSILIYFRCRSTGRIITSAGSKPINSWNDGTENGANDLIPVSPPPEYSRAQQPSEAASNNVQDASLSRSFCYDAINATSPPPAYHSRSSSNNDNSSISDLSNVDAMESSLEIKEMNVPFDGTLTSNGPVSPIYSVPHSGVSASDAPYNGARQGPPRDTWI